MAVGAVAATAAWCGGMTPALGAGARDASVIVDLSVIDAAAGHQYPTGPAGASSGQLLLPGSGQPVSRLYLPTESAPTRGGPATGHDAAGMAYGRLVVPAARAYEAARGRAVTLRRPGLAPSAAPFSTSSSAAPTVLADAEAMPRPSAGSPASAAGSSTGKLFPPPQGFTQASVVTARGSTSTGTAAPAAFAAFPPPAPLAVAAAAVAAREPAASVTPKKVSSLWAFSPAPRPRTSSTEAASPLGAAVPAAKPEGALSLAAIEPVSKARMGERFRLIYSPRQVELSIPLRRELEPVVADLRKRDELRVQVAAYAGAKDEPTSKARRISLSRALAIRGHLIDNGIKASRIDVRALGNRSGASAAERVDVEVIDK